MNNSPRRKVFRGGLQGHDNVNNDNTHHDDNYENNDTNPVELNSATESILLQQNFRNDKDIYLNLMST